MEELGTYIQLVWLFVLFIAALALCLGWMFFQVKRAQEGERESRVFSRETVMAQEKERSRIARELHDTVVQDLWRLSLQADRIVRVEGAGERGRLCAEVGRGHRELMVRVRGIYENLVPPDFQTRGLLDALRTLCEDFMERTGVKCVFAGQEGAIGEMDGDSQLQCFRIVQECLSNIEKHAGATETSVVVRREDENTLLIVVSDNGKGFVADKNGINYHSGHFGLKGMNERAAFVSGKLTVDSAVGEGTMVCLRILSPLADNNSLGGG